MIIKDDEPVEMVQRSLDSVKDYVDGLYITVTYKKRLPAKSALIDLLHKYGAHVSLFKWVYNFATARNFAMQQVPKGPTNFIYWQDADDVLKNGENIKDIAEDMVKFGQAAVYFEYWYQVDLDKDGNVREILINHKRERLIRHDDTFSWIGDLHETLIYQRQENVVMVARTECVVVHLSAGERLEENIKRNIEILETAFKKEEGKDPRTTVYLARAYLDMAKMSDKATRQEYLDKSLKLYHAYLNGTGEVGTRDYREMSGWAEERSTAWSQIGEIAVLMGNFQIAANAFQSAIDEAPWFPNYYISLAMCYIELGNFKKARQWLTVGTATPMPHTTIITFPRDLKANALEVSFNLNMHEQKLNWALEDVKKQLEIFPDSPGLLERLDIVTSLVAYNKACQSVMFLGKYLEQIKEPEKIVPLIDAIPKDMRQEKWAAEMRHLFLPPRKWENNEVAIICGPGWEEWTPKSMVTGLGGSETAVVVMGQELTKLGWKVTVYGNPGKDAGNYDGVEYKVWHDINVKDEFNVLVLWRSIGFVDINPKAKFTVLWLHDVPSNPDFTQERVDKVDKIAVLSDYHKSLLRVAKNGTFEPMPEEKVFVTANGITPISITEWQGNPKRLIYSSSPDRGLVYLLRMWPEIKKAVPEAELHVFYGFKIYDAIHHNNPARMAWKDTVMALMKQDGIHYHDRIGKEELYKEINKSGIWAYPTDFTEISCITAMEMQALGAIPVCTTLAALNETVRNGIKLDVDITDEAAQKEYQQALIDLLQHPEKQAEIRPDMMKWARSYYQWSRVAGMWDQLFRVKIQNQAF